jgi:hypothetical protein
MSAIGHFYAKDRSPAHARSYQLRRWFHQRLVVGVTVVAVDGGGIRTMSRRWEAASQCGKGA